METNINIQCPACGKELSVEYWRVGMTSQCSSCGKEFQITLSQPVSFHYETTYTEFIKVLTHLKNYSGVQQFLTESLKVEIFDLQNNSVIKADGRNSTLAELHEAIQQNPQWQSSLYNRRMDVER